MTRARVPAPRAPARGAGLVLAVLAVLVVGVGPAYAHSQLVAMSPANGSLVSVAPTSVVLTFDAPIQDIGGSVVVLAPSGAHVESGAPVVVDATATQALRPLTEPGYYRVAYRIVSGDGHPVSRELGFSYLSRGTPAPSGSSSPAAQADGSGWPVGGIAIGVGIVALGVGLWRLRRRGASGT